MYDVRQFNNNLNILRKNARRNAEYQCAKSLCNIMCNKPLN